MFLETHDFFFLSLLQFHLHDGLDRDDCRLTCSVVFNLQHLVNHRFFSSRHDFSDCLIGISCNIVIFFIGKGRNNNDRACSYWSRFFNFRLRFRNLWLWLSSLAELDRWLLRFSYFSFLLFFIFSFSLLN